VLKLPEAIQKMTSLNAQKIGIRDRGLLRVGYKADVTIFDPEKVIDLATYENPHKYPIGIPYVVVNGEIVLDNGQHTGALPGQVLRGPGYRNRH
jgi:N-acyl-D-aspartate/D-glutamate deacylase